MKKLVIGLAILFSVTARAQVSIWRTPTFTGRTDSARVHISEMLNGRVYDRSMRLDSLTETSGVSVQSIPGMNNYQGPSNSITVTDTVKGGVFDYINGTAAVDNGITFAATGKGSGYWKRRYDDFVHIKWFPTVADSATDNFAVLQTILTNYKYVYIDPGWYAVSASAAVTTLGLHPQSGAIIKGAGYNNSVIYQTGVTNGNDATYFYMFNLEDKSYVTIQDIAVIGQNSSGAGMALGGNCLGVYMAGSATRNIVTRCNFSYIWGSGVLDYNSLGYNTYTYNIASRNGKNGLNPGGLHQTITNNKVSYNNTGGIEGGMGYSLVAFNESWNNGTSGIAVGGYSGAVSGEQGESNEVIYNNIHNNPTGLAISDGTRNSFISGNIVRNNSGNGIQITTTAVATTHGNRIANNKVTNNGAIGIYSATKLNEITNNNVGNDSTGGQYIQAQGIVLAATADSNRISNNYCIGHPTADYNLGAAKGVYFQNPDSRSIISTSTSLTMFSNGMSTTTVSASYSVKVTDEVLLINTNSARTITLPAAASYPKNKILTIKDNAGTGAGSNKITVTPAGTDVIDGDATKIINIDRGVAKIFSDGVSRWISVDNELGYLPTPKNVTANYTLLSSDNTIEVTATGVTLTLPSSGNLVGKVFTVVNSSTGTVAWTASGQKIRFRGVDMLSMPAGSTWRFMYSTTNGSYLLMNQTFNDNSVIKQTHTSGASITIGNTTNWLVVNPASTLASLTITTPATPVDAQRIEISFGGTLTSGAVVTSLTISSNTGQGIIQSSVPLSSQAGDVIKYRYNASNSQWYRL